MIFLHVQANYSKALVLMTRMSHRTLFFFFDLDTARVPFDVDLRVRLCVCDTGVSRSDIYDGVILFNALYMITALIVVIMPFSNGLPAKCAKHFRRCSVVICVENYTCRTFL